MGKESEKHHVKKDMRICTVCVRYPQGVRSVDKKVM